MSKFVKAAQGRKIARDNKLRVTNRVGKPIKRRSKVRRRRKSATTRRKKTTTRRRRASFPPLPT